VHDVPGCRAVRGVGFGDDQDNPPGIGHDWRVKKPQILVHCCGGALESVRSVLVFENRLLEMLIYLVVGIIFLVLGLLSANVNYQVLFFILTAFFIFAIFRPTSLS